MKTINLIRHAKSSWKDMALADIDRPLNKRGRNACPLMADKISASGCKFEDVYCSPAIRAQSTIERIAESLPTKKIKWEVDEQLYTFDSDDLVSWCQAFRELKNQIVIIGHNPALTDFVNWLCSSNIENIPTCGYVRVHCKSETWRHLHAGCGEMSEFLYPKMYLA